MALEPRSREGLLPGTSRAPIAAQGLKGLHGDSRFLRRVNREGGRAEQVVLVQDNLNPHNAGSFYENLPAEEAFELAQRFEMHYTPKKGSWLNIAELELSALARTCLSRRVSSIEELDREAQALVKERNERKVKVGGIKSRQVPLQYLKKKGHIGSIELSPR